MWNKTKEYAQIIAFTLGWTLFMLVGMFGALSLRGDIKFDGSFNATLGNLLAVFVMITLLTIVYKSNKK